MVTIRLVRSAQALYRIVGWQLAAASCQPTILFTILDRSVVSQCRFQDPGERLQALTSTHPDAVQLIGHLAILDSREKREWIKRRSHVAIVKEICQNILLLEEGIVMEWFASWIAEKLHWLTEPRFKLVL